MNKSRQRSSQEANKKAVTTHTRTHSGKTKGKLAVALCLLCQACELIPGIVVVLSVSGLVAVVFCMLPVTVKEEQKARSAPALILLYYPVVSFISCTHYFYFSRVHVTQNL